MRIDTNMPLLNNMPGVKGAPTSHRDVAVGEEDRLPSTGIGEQLKNAINHVNELQQSADQMIEQVSLGNVEDTHKAMISMEKALLALNFTISVRNKALEAYQEIMRMQV